MAAPTVQPDMAKAPSIRTAAIQATLRRIEIYAKNLGLAFQITDDMLDAYIALKMEEVTRFRMTTHPVEFDMYFSL